MAEFSIKLFEFALIVHRPVGLSVLFLAPDHGLQLTTPDGQSRPVAPGSSITITDDQGVPLRGAPTAVDNKGAFVFDLPTVLGRNLEVSPQVLTGMIDPAQLNARVELPGGKLIEHPCSIDPDMTWTFDTGTRAVTDSALYVHTIDRPEQFFLKVKNTLIGINPGDRFELSNRDQVGTVGEFVHLEEFEALCRMTGASGAPPPVNLRVPSSIRRIGAFYHVSFAADASPYLRGETAVCAIGGIDSNG